MADTKITVNGILHDWESITVVGPHGTFLGISEITWKSAQTKENRYGKGGVARGVGRKNYEPEASVTLDTDEFNRFEGSLANGLYRTRFNLSITLEPPDSPAESVDLVSCYVNDVDDGASQGDEKVEKKLSLRVGMIHRNGRPEYE